MDSYVKAWVKNRVKIDAGNRAFDKKTGEELRVVMSQFEGKPVRKVLLPISKILYTFDDLKRAGAECDAITLRSMAQNAAETRWKDTIERRSETGIPSNVYVANARTIQLAIEKGLSPPAVRWVGRKQGRITEVRDTIDEVVDDIANDRWRTTFNRGRHKGK